VRYNFAILRAKKEVILQYGFSFFATQSSIILRKKKKVIFVRYKQTFFLRIVRHKLTICES